MTASPLGGVLRLAIFDMDGVLFRMHDPLPCADQAVRLCRELGMEVRFLTNNSSKTRLEYVEKLSRFGITAIEADVMTSAYATALTLSYESSSPLSAFVVGEEGLKSELRFAGIEVLSEGTEDTPNYVVAGWDRHLTYDKLAEAHRHILAGAKFVATNRDATYPDSGGRTLPGGGVIVAAIETCTGQSPRVIGKPETTALDLLLTSVDVSPSQVLVIGDRLDTDVRLGNQMGCRTVLVLTGVSTLEQVKAAPESDRPSLVLTDLCEFCDVLSGAVGGRVREGEALAEPLGRLGSSECSPSRLA